MVEAQVATQHPLFLYPDPGLCWSNSNLISQPNVAYFKIEQMTLFLSFLQELGQIGTSDLLSPRVDDGDKCR